jgi:putative membrane protein
MRFAFRLLTFPIVILALGLFLLVINALMLWFTSALSEVLDLDFRVSGFWSALWGAFVVSVVSGLALLMLRTDQQVRYRTFY